LSFFWINLCKIQIARELLGFDPMGAAQNPGNRRLKYQNLDFKELNSSVGRSCDGYGEAIVNVRVSRAQGQMSQDLADRLWKSVRQGT